MGVSQAKSLLQRVGFTQAEAYFQGSSDPDDYLYFMRWKARLRRFQGAAGGGAGGLVQQALGSSANRLIFH
jgi:hypothetical protein